MPEQVQTRYHLTSVNELVASVDLPTDFAVALASGRPELTRLIHRPNGLNEKETLQIAHAFGVLLETHQALQDQVKLCGQEIDQLRNQAKGFLGKLDKVNDLVHFREPLDTTDEY
jgi:hypothetical protein